MNKRVSTRLAPVIGFGLVALSVGIFVGGQNTSQARTLDEKTSETSEKVRKLAVAIKKGDKDAIKAQAAKLAELDHDAFMDAFKVRDRGGIGFGKKAGAFPIDGIELKLQELGRDAPGAAALGKQAEALEDMAWDIAAIAEVALAKGPPADLKGQKKDWDTWSKEMKDASASLTAAVKAKSGNDVKTVATKINNNCAACHTAFKPK